MDHNYDLQCWKSCQFCPSQQLSTDVETHMDIENKTVHEKKCSFRFCLMLVTVVALPDDTPRVHRTLLYASLSIYGCQGVAVVAYLHGVS